MPYFDGFTEFDRLMKLLDYNEIIIVNLKEKI